MNLVVALVAIPILALALVALVLRNPVWGRLVLAAALTRVLDRPGSAGRRRS